MLRGTPFLSTAPLKSTVHTEGKKGGASLSREESYRQASVPTAISKSACGKITQLLPLNNAAGREAGADSSINPSIYDSPFTKA